MGFGSNKETSKSKKETDRVIQAFRSLGSPEEKTRQDATKKVTGMGIDALPYLFAVIENRQMEDEWNAAESNLKTLNHDVWRGVSSLIEDLNSPNKPTLKSALKRLSSLPKDSQELIRALASLKNARDMNRTQRKTAIKVMSDISIPPFLYPNVIQVLVKALSDVCDEVSEAAVDRLKPLGSAAIPALAAAFSSASAKIKLKILTVFETIKPCSAEAIAALVHALGDADGDVTLKAIRVLEGMASLPKDVVTPLLHVNAHILIAQIVLAKHGASHLEELIRGMTDSNDAVKMSAAEVLGEVGPAAKSALSGLYGLLKSSDEDIRDAAATAICKIKPEPGDASILIESIGDNSDARESIEESLALCGKTAVPLLTQKLNAGSKQERVNAAQVLGMMKTDAADALGDLEKALDDSNKDVRSEALTAISNIGIVSKSLSDKLFEKWKKHGGSDILMVLSKIRDPRVIEIVLKSAFNAPSDGYPSQMGRYLECFAGTGGLDGSIVRWALNASTYEHKYTGMRYDAGYISLDLSNGAVQSLCNMKNGITSNILHLIAKKADVSVSMSTGCGQDWDERVSFEEQRKKAIKELEARGNPPYNPTLFTDSAKAGQDDVKAQVLKEQQNERDRRYRELIARAQNPSMERGESKWTFYDDLAKEYKTGEVFQMLVRDLARYRTIPLGDLSHFEWLLVQIAQELDDQAVIGMLLPIQPSWPNLFNSVLDRSREMKKTNAQR